MGEKLKLKAEDGYESSPTSHAQTGTQLLDLWCCKRRSG